MRNDGKADLGKAAKPRRMNDLVRKLAMLKFVLGVDEHAVLIAVRMLTPWDTNLPSLTCS
jgi:hypothetical protein